MGNKKTEFEKKLYITEIKKLFSSITSTFMRQIFSLFVNTCNIILISRVLGPENNGYYTVAILLPTMLAIFMNFGVSPANVYYIGRRSVSPATACKVSFYLWIFFSLTGLFVGTAIIYFKGKAFFPGVPHVLLLLALTSFPLILMQGYAASILQGRQSFKILNFISALSSISFSFSLIIFYMFNPSTYKTIIAFVLSQCITNFVSFFYIKKEILNADNFQDKFDNYTLKAIKYGYKAHLSNILTFFNYRIDIFLVNFLMNASFAGIYFIAVTASEKIWVLSSSICTVIFPKLSELHGDVKKFNNFSPFIARWTLVFVTIAATILAFLSYPLINLFFGKEYIEAIIPILLLLPGIVMASLTKIFANDIAAQGHPELNLYPSLIVLIINVAGNIYLIPKLGLSGAALSTTISYGFQMILTTTIYLKLNKLLIQDVFCITQEDKILINLVSKKIYRKK